jgi:hypothetical protein
MAEGKGTLTTPKQEKEAQQSKPWTLKEFGGKPVWEWMQLLHQLCQFHYLREAAKEVYEADRHAKKELKKLVRGVRPIERELESREDPEAEAMRGYCLAVRSAITDDGRPPLSASGIKLHDRLGAIHSSIERAGAKRGFPES